MSKWYKEPASWAIVFAIVVLIGVLALFACQYFFAEEGDPPIRVIDGCQYFVQYTYGGGRIYTHLGNCTNQIHIK